MCDFGLADLPLTSVTYCPSLPNHSPLDVDTHTQTHVTCGKTRRGPRHPSLTGWTSLYPASRTSLLAGNRHYVCYVLDFSFIKLKLLKSAPRNVSSAVSIILHCPKITATAAAWRPVGSGWHLKKVDHWVPQHEGDLT